MDNKITIEESERVLKAKSQEAILKENKALMDKLSAFTTIDKKKESTMDPEVLKRLKSKLEDTQEQAEEEPMEVVASREVSIEMAIIGVGQAGSRIAEVFHKLGYDAAVINTSAQDLKFIDVLPTQKLLLEGTLGGTGKDLDLGREIFGENTKNISNFINPVLEGNDMAYLAVSGGGGSGASSVDVMVNLLFGTGIPVGVIYILPKATDDAQSKRNSIEIR